MRRTLLRDLASRELLREPRLPLSKLRTDEEKRAPVLRCWRTTFNEFLSTRDQPVFPANTGGLSVSCDKRKLCAKKSRGDCRTTYPAWFLWVWTTNDGSNNARIRFRRAGGQRRASLVPLPRTPLFPFLFRASAFGEGFARRCFLFFVPSKGVSRAPPTCDPPPPSPITRPVLTADDTKNQSAVDVRVENTAHDAESGGCIQCIPLISNPVKFSKFQCIYIY